MSEEAAAYINKLSLYEAPDDAPVAMTSGPTWSPECACLKQAVDGRERYLRMPFLRFTADTHEIACAYCGKAWKKEKTE